MPMLATRVVETRVQRGKLRTVEVKTGKIARTSLGNPIDGGGWKPSAANRRKAERQAVYVNTDAR
jgi:hypothetical protein